MGTCSCGRNSCMECFTRCVRRYIAGFPVPIVNTPPTEPPPTYDAADIVAGEGSPSGIYLPDDIRSAIQTLTPEPVTCLATNTSSFASNTILPVLMAFVGPLDGIWDKDYRSVEVDAWGTYSLFDDAQLTIRCAIGSTTTNPAIVKTGILAMSITNANWRMNARIFKTSTIGVVRLAVTVQFAKESGTQEMEVYTGYSQVSAIDTYIGVVAQFNVKSPDNNCIVQGLTVNWGNPS